MTASEAIKWLKAIEKKYIHGGDEAFDNSRKVAISTAISALEKQIPKKVKEYKEFEDGTFYNLDFMCPVCGNTVIGQPYKPDCCKHCGQALDWGDTE